jgi:hypothetical protein
MTLKREQILAADDLRTEEVHVPEWATAGDDVVVIRTLTGKERDKFEASMVRMGRNGKPEQNLANLRARLVILTAIDPDDNNLPIFSEKDIDFVGGKSAAALDRVFGAAQKLNGFSSGDVEALAEGFDGDQSESSTSD